MCPDQEILSAYLDGEVEPPWSGTIAAHLSCCLSCQSRLARMEEMRRLLQSERQPAWQAPMERIRMKLLAQRVRKPTLFLPFWRKTLTVPLPLAAGAAIVVLLLAASLMIVLLRSNIGLVRITKAPAGGTEIQIAAPIGNLENLLKTFDSRSSNQDVITLPNNYPLMPVGQPFMGKEAELIRKKTW